MSDRSDREQHLLHLVDRARRGVTLDAELDLLAAGITEQAARITTLEHVAAGNKRHVQMLIPELEQAEAAITRVRAALDDADWGGPDRHDVITEIRTALDQPQQPEAHQHVWTTVPANGAYGRLIGHTWTRCGICDQTQQTTT